MNNWMRAFRIAEFVFRAAILALVIGVPMAFTAPEARRSNAIIVAIGIPAGALACAFVIGRIASRRLPSE